MGKDTHPGRAVPGVAVAGVTALVSGVSVFVNSYAVRSYGSPAVYTTAKNLVASVILGVVALVALRSGATGFSGFAVAPIAPPRASRIGAWLGLAYVGVIGGGLAFVLFFNGLALSPPASAALWRDTLLVWVALGAVVILGERVRWQNLAAIALLVAGEITLTGGIGQLAANRGELDVLTSSVLWAMEIIVAKRLLREVSPARLALVRMGGGGLTLVAYLWASGTLGALSQLTRSEVGWALLTGALLALYVGTWLTALARARALDVTSVLVGGALVTWLLQWAAGSASPAPSSLGLVLIAVGVALVGTAMARVGARRRAARA